MKSAVPDWAETGLKEAAAILDEASRRRASSSWIVDESERETSSARVSTAATGAGMGCSTSQRRQFAAWLCRRAAKRERVSHVVALEELAERLDRIKSIC